MKNIFDNVNFNGLNLKNRLVRSATGENLATSEGYIPQDLFNIYRELAEGGVGMIILSFTSVAPVDHFNEGLLRLHDDALIPEYRKLAEMIHSYDCVTMPQLALGIYQRKDEKGRYKQIGITQMDDDDIREVIRKFVSAASRAKEAGFDGVQLHGCHDFVLSQFLYPSRNHRTDEYGGTVAGRAKIFVDIIRGIREIAGNMHISIKINGNDLPPEDMQQTLKLLVDAGLDSIEYEGHYSEHVNSIQSITGVPVILTGGHRRAEQVNLLLNQYRVEFFGLSRPLIREAGLPNRWKSEDIRPSDCRSCGLCMTTYGFRCALKKSNLIR